MDYFWKIWSQYYVLELNQHHTNASNDNLTPKEDDIVLLHEKRPRHFWRNVITSHSVFGRDGKARAAEVVSAGRRSEDRCN